MELAMFVIKPISDESQNIAAVTVTAILSNLVNIKEICDMGISSLKIEGRMRSIYYIATVVGIYRKVIDTYYNDKDNFKYDEKLEKVLTRCANRDSISQFFNGNFGKEAQYYNGRVEVSNQDFLGLVLDYKDGIVTLQQRNYFKKGDVVEFFGPNLDAFEYTINEVYDEDGNQIDIVRHPKQIVSFKVPKELHQFDMMRIK
jgi:putative protease